MLPYVGWRRGMKDHCLLVVLILVVEALLGAFTMPSAAGWMHIDLQAIPLGAHA